MYKVINRAIFVSITLYTPIGILGYLSYLDDIPKLVIFRDPIEGSFLYDWPMVAARILLALTLTLSIPININPNRLTLKQAFFGSDGG